MYSKYKTSQIRRKTIRHYNIIGHAHFLTFSCYQRLPFLGKERARRWLIDAVLRAREKHRYALLAYVIMPEHVHLLVYPLDYEYNISLFLKSVKQSVARRARSYLEENDRNWLERLIVKRGNKHVFRFWQAGPGYDRNIVNKEELFEKIKYIHNNPVRSELVSNPEEWKWSSAGWYNGEKDVVMTLDELII